MELKWIEDFLCLIETRSFSQAAVRRHITQPAFSRRIRALENWVGTYLVDRTSYPPNLTPAGEIFKTEAVEILSRIRRARSRIHGNTMSYVQTLELVLAHTFSPIEFAPWLTQVEQCLSKINFELSVVSVPDPDFIHDNLAEGGRLLMGYDHPNCPANVDSSCYEVATLGRQFIRPYVRAVRGRKPMFELPGRRNAPVPLLTYRPDSYMHRVTGLMLRQAPASFVERYRADTIERLKGMAMEGHGIAFLPESVVREDVERRYLTLAGDERWQLELNVCLYRCSKDRNPDVDRIWIPLKHAVQSTHASRVRRLAVVQ